MDIREASLDELDAASTFLQSGFWARFKAEAGWKARPFMVRGLPGLAGDQGLLVLERGLKPGLRFAYVPHGPALDPEGRLSDVEKSAVLAELARGLGKRLPPSSIFLRFDPPWYFAEGEGHDPEAGLPARPRLEAPFRHSAADIQPPDSVLLDLSQGEEGLLEGMKPKWRYNIRLAEKKGVEVSGVGCQGDWREELTDFYRLYEETSKRDRIALHPESYYRRLFELGASPPLGGGKGPDLRIWTARHEGDAIAAIITVFWGGQAVYLYGASSNEKRNLMPAYALQWAAIRAAKAAGCVEYDFYGIPPSDDPEHPMAGLYRFKTGFGGRIIHRPGSWDYPLRPLAYAAFRKAETLRLWYYKDFKKRGGKAKPRAQTQSAAAASAPEAGQATS